MRVLGSFLSFLKFTWNSSSEQKHATLYNLKKLHAEMWCRLPPPPILFSCSNATMRTRQGIEEGTGSFWELVGRVMALGKQPGSNTACERGIACGTRQYKNLLASLWCCRLGAWSCSHLHLPDAPWLCLQLTDILAHSRRISIPAQLLHPKGRADQVDYSESCLPNTHPHLLSYMGINLLISVSLVS